MSRQCVLTAPRASCTLGNIKRIMASRSREVILPLYSIIVRPCLEYFNRLWDPQYKKDVDEMEQLQRRVMKMLRGLEHLSCEDRLGELRLFRLESRRLRETFQCLKGAYKKDVEELFARACRDRTRGNGFKLAEGDMSTLQMPLTLVLCSEYRKDIEVLEHVQRRAMKVVKGLEHNEELLRKLRLFSLERRRLREDLTALYRTL
ncbi:hypothetical protein WISP_50318 [Willisornis vidua]|uniref:Uncharacterized protein n=1 Tax=Willisornis vidua TaxID=1566151 RepID=A0ABQ9DIC5_9PASS|nr:hypothetical protein WISP_50318 [Willisornis vidua]